ALVLESAGTRSVPDGVAPLGRQRCGGGAPRCPALFVAQVQHFAGRVTDRIVMPRSETIEVAARGPGTAGAPLGHQEPAGGIGDHVGPRRRRQSAVVDTNLVVAVACRGPEGCGGAGTRRRGHISTPVL